MKDSKSTFSWHRVLAFCILFVQVTMIVPAQELYLGHQLSERYLEQYLDRADLESSQQRWQQLAEQGILVALTAWESASNYLLEQDPKTWQKERDSIQERLGQQTEIRLAQWLLDNLLKTEVNPNFQQFASELEQRTSQWQFQQTETDGTVNVTSQIDKNQVSLAENQWLQSNEELVKKYIDMASIDEDLLRNKIKDLDLEENEENELVAQAISTYKNYLSTEYDLILKSETMDLMGNFLYDRESIRVASAKESADSIALELIQEAENSTSISFQKLFNNFEKDIDKQGSDEKEVQVSGENWAQDFQRQLEEGLAVWDSVEEEFLYQRSLWEQDAIEVYEEGEDAWLKAFQQLKYARQEWEDKIIAEFQKGMEEWSQSQAQQELDIQKAQEELTLSLQEEIQRKEELGMISASIYNQVRTLLSSCYDGVKNWYSNWAQKYKKIYSYWKTEDTQRYNQLFSYGELEGLNDALTSLEKNETWTINLEDLSSSTTRSKMEQQIQQWKIAYVEWFKEEINNVIQALEVKNENDKLTLENLVKEKDLLESNSMTDTSGDVDKKKQEILQLKEQIQSDSDKVGLLKGIIEKSKSLTIDTSETEIISLFTEPIVKTTLDVTLDISLWESSEGLLHQDNGWLTLASSGFSNLETATNNFLTAIDPTSFEDSSSDLDAEIHQLESLLTYWQDELAVAKEIKDYATTTTSSAETATETQQNLITSEKAFQQTLEEYQNQQQVVQENIDSLKEVTNQLDMVQTELKERESIIAEIKNKIVAIEEIEKGLDKEVVIGKLIKSLDSLSQIFSQEVKDEINNLVESYSRKEFETGNITFIDTLELIIKNIPRNFREKSELQLEELIETSSKVIGQLETLENMVFFPTEEVTPEEVAPEGDGNQQSSENLILLQKTLLSLEDFVKIVLQESELVSEGENLKTLVEELDDDIKNQQEPNLQTLIQQIKDISSKYSKELKYRQDALIFLTEGEPESWKLVEENTPEAAEYQLIKDTFGHLQVTTLNEKHSSSLKEIETLLENTNIWNNITWTELVSTMEKLRQTGMSLHSGTYSVLSQLFTTIVQHWCLQNPSAKSNWNENTLAHRNTIQQGINDILAVENDLLNSQIILQFTNTDIYSQFEEEEKKLFSDYLEQLEKNNENSQPILADANEQIARIQTILSGKKLNLEEQDFLLGLEELQAKYLQDNSQIELENLLSQCYDIDGSSILSPNDWLIVKEMLESSGFRTMRLKQLQNLGEQWIKTIYDCGDEPYNYELVTQSLTEDSLQLNQEQQENSLLDLKQITTLLEISSYNTDLAQSVDLYIMMNSNMQNLLNEKTNFESQLLLEEKERQKILEKYEKVYTQIHEKMEMYQKAVEKEEILHQAFVQSRLQQRIAQEKYQWATRIYLESMGNSNLQENSQYASPLRRYNDVLLVVNRYENALDILYQMKNQQQMQDKDYLNQVNDYSKSLENAYLMEVILSQVLDEVVKQEQITRDAEIKDEMNVSKLFKDYESIIASKADPEKDGINTAALELIRIKKTETGDYVFSLGYETGLQKIRIPSSTNSLSGEDTFSEYEDYVTSKKTGIGDLDENLLTEYLTNSSETLIRVDGSIQQTRAEVELRQWFKDIYAKGDDYINNLLLASLHLKTYTSDGIDFLDGQSDIRNSGDFQADQVPEVRKFHSIDTKQRYNSERRDVVANAYNYIISRPDGESDLARYILYRETNLLNENNWHQKERDLVKWLALDEVRDVLSEKKREKTIEAAAAYASAAALAAAAALFQPWLWAAVGLATGIGIVATDAAISIGATMDGISDLMRGSKENVETETNRINNLVSGLITGEKNLEEQWQILNELYYGSETIMDEHSSSNEKPNLSSQSILAVLDEIFSDNSLVNKNEYQELLSSQLLNSTMEQMVISPETLLKITDVLQEVLKTLKTGLQEEEEKLSLQVLNMEESSFTAMTNFHQILEKSITITEEDKQRLSQLESMATDESLSTSQRQTAMEDFEKLFQSLNSMDIETKNRLTQLATEAYGTSGWNNLSYKKNLYNTAMSLYNSKIDIQKETEEYTLWLQDLLLQQGVASWQDTASRLLIQSNHEWQLEQDLLLRRQSLWEGEVLETLVAGRNSWQQVEEKLNKKYSLWRRQFQNELEDRQAEWQNNHLDFLKKKEEWIQNSHKTAIQQGLVKSSEAISSVNLKDIEEDIKYLSRIMESSISSKETEATVDAILADSYLDNLINRASILTGFGNDSSFGIKKSRRNTSSLESHLLARQQVEKNTILMTNLAGRQAATYGQEILEEILSNYMEGIDSQNQSMVDWLHHLARDAGYRVDGSIRRTVVVDATLFNPIKKTQYLPQYQYYSVVAPQLRKLDTSSSKNAMLQLGLAQEQLQLWGQEILGTGGQLEKHIGQSPELGSNSESASTKEEAFSKFGSGQRGAILVEYYWNSIQAKKGMTELSKAGHDKRLFDDRGLPFTAPTLREVTEVAMNIVGTATGQAWWFSYIDDAIFAGIDLGGGYKTASEIGRELAIKAASAAIGAGTSWAGDVVGKALAESSKATNFLVQGSISGGSAYLGGLTTNYIATGEWNWADEGSLSGLAGGFVSGGLGGVNLGDGNGIKLNDKVFDVEGISAMNGLVGGLASTAVSFGMTGNATFNLASIEGVGLLELTMGKNGVSSRLGSGGMSLSAETLTAVSRGRHEVRKVMDWKYGGEESRSTLNGVNDLGHTNLEMNHRLANDIWDEEIGVNFGDIEGGYGLYRHGENSITLDRNLLGCGIEGSAKLATVLAHEGTHLYGKRMEGVAHLQGAATYMQLLEKFNRAGDKAFAGEIMAGLAAPSSWVENTGDEDWWKQIWRNDGSFAWQEDGSLDFTFEDGTVVSAEEMKAFISSYTVRIQARSAGVGVFESNDAIISDAGKAMTKVFSKYLKNTSAVLPMQGVEKYVAFVHGTEAFADASIAAQGVMNSIDWGESGEVINRGLAEMNSHLMRIQEGDFLVKNKATEIDGTNRLIGEGTSDLPYFPLVGYIDSEGDLSVKITGYDGWRLNDKEMAGISPNYVLYEFSKYHHEGWDGVGKGDIVASLDGNIYLDYLRAEGFQVNLESGTDVFKTSHANSNTIMSYMNLFGQEGSNLILDGGMHKLDGIRAGEVIGRMGNTGANSTGAHAHMSINGRGDLFAEKFNKSIYTNHLKPDAYAQYMSGYKNKTFSGNLQLWANVKEFSEQRPDLLNFDDFKKQHSNEVPLIFQ